ncbi:MAG: hypothetical protein K8S97_05615 [Anaerolineae bacterium]|nr:hypothetical protein [Anaerolineae bacterium]
MIPVRRTLHRTPVILLALFAALLTGLVPAQAAPPLQGPQRITYDVPVTGQITFDAPEEEWIFDGSAGDVVLIDMWSNEGSSLDTYVTLLDPSGMIIESNDDGGEGLNSRIGPLPLPADGAYTILASNYSGTGSYTLDVKNLNTIPTLVLDKRLVGLVNADQPMEYFRMTVPPDQEMMLVRLTIEDDNASASPYITVYSGSGLIANTEYSEADTIDPIALLPGESYVVVITWNTYGSGGPYELTMTLSEIGVLEDGVTQNGTLDYNNYNKQHFFVADEGDVIHITITVDGDIAPALEVVSADHSRYVFSNNGEFVRALDVTLEIPDDGVYIVEVYDGSFMGDDGSYDLTVTWQE